jgi:hypothetical protein
MQGFWSCQNSMPLTNVTGACVLWSALCRQDARNLLPIPYSHSRDAFACTGGQSGEAGPALDSLVYLFGSTDDMAKFGGQARCPESRCLTSSLLETSRVLKLDTLFPEYGLCYKTNCYTSSYLQVAVVGQLGGSFVYWYGCPPGGGKLYIPGFFGALTCPPAAQFCAMERVTGVRFPERSVIAEAVFWAVVTGGLLVVVVLCLVPQYRTEMLRCNKRACGVLQFPDEEREEARKSHAELVAARKQQHTALSVVAPWARTTLMAVSIVLLVLGAAVLGLVVYLVSLVAGDSHDTPPQPPPPSSPFHTRTHFSALFCTTDCFCGHVRHHCRPPV